MQSEAGGEEAEEEGLLVSDYNPPELTWLLGEMQGGGVFLIFT